MTPVRPGTAQEHLRLDLHQVTEESLDALQQELADLEDDP
tara:strand:- start:677 stop:796 length:120 start_codon:yes stop_codon:yes gene_type:complete